MNQQEMITVIELANRLRVPASWVYSRTRETGPGTIPCLRVGKYLRFKEEQVLEWLKKKSEDD